MYENLVELVGLEPTTSSLRTMRSSRLAATVQAIEAFAETPTSCASACQCRGCGRYPRRMRPAYQRDTPIREAIAEVEIAASRG